MAQITRIEILALLVVVASACFAQDKTSPIAIDCTFHSNLDVLKKLRFPGYSTTKVAPETSSLCDPMFCPGVIALAFSRPFGTWVKGLDTLTAPSTGARLALGCERSHPPMVQTWLLIKSRVRKFAFSFFEQRTIFTRLFWAKKICNRRDDTANHLTNR